MRQISSCKYCENFSLKTLHAKLAGFDRESAILSRRSGGLLPPRSLGLDFGCRARGFAFMHLADTKFFRFRSRITRHFPPSGQEAQPSPAYTELVDVLPHATEKEEESFSRLVGLRRTAKTYLSISKMLSSNCATLATKGTSRSTGHFPSLATVEDKRHSRFSPRRVAAGCRQCTRGKGRPALSLHQYLLPLPLRPH